MYDILKIFFRKKCTKKCEIIHENLVGVNAGFQIDT